jgi:hypothetical protein
MHPEGASGFCVSKSLLQVLLLESVNPLKKTFAKNKNSAFTLSTVFADFSDKSMTSKDFFAAFSMMTAVFDES